MSPSRSIVAASSVAALVALICGWLVVTGSLRGVGTLSTAGTAVVRAQQTSAATAASSTTAVSPQASPRSRAADRLTPPTTIPVFERRTIRISATGDLLIHGPVRRVLATGSDTYDFRPSFALVADQLRSADLAICHLETPIASDNRDVSSYPSFNVPTELAFAIADAGFDTCSTASNHSLDAGINGIDATLDLLDDAGVDHVGTARDAEEAAEAVVYEVNGVRIGHGSYSYWFNGYQRPEDKPWVANPIDVDEMIRHSRLLRDAGAEIVILSIHWGLEYQVDPTIDQVELAERLMAESTVDLILGHHAHVVQPVDLVNDKLVVYGLGNFLSGQRARCCGIRSEEGVIVGIDFVEQGDGTMAFTSIDATPTWVDSSDYRILHRNAVGDSAQAQIKRLDDATKRVLEALNRRLPERNMVSEPQ